MRLGEGQWRGVTYIRRYVRRSWDCTARDRVLIKVEAESGRATISCNWACNPVFLGNYGWRTCEKAGSYHNTAHMARPKPKEELLFPSVPVRCSKANRCVPMSMSTDIHASTDALGGTIVVGAQGLKWVGGPLTTKVSMIFIVFVYAQDL